MQHHAKRVGVVGRVAVLSHVLPPSPSGQAVVLSRLLDGLAMDGPVLLSPRDYAVACDEVATTRRLQAEYVYVRPSWLERVLEQGHFPLWTRAAGTPVGWGRRARLVHRAIAARKCGVLVACTGDLLNLPAGCLAARRAGVPFVAYMFDDYVYQWTGACRLVARCLESWVRRHTAAVIVPNESLQRMIEARWQMLPSLVRNPCGTLADFRAPGAAPSRKRGRIVYTGAVYNAHYDAFRNLIAALDMPGGQGGCLHIYSEHEEWELARHGIEGPHVRIHRSVSEDEARHAALEADILFLPLAFRSPIRETVRTAAPGKMSDYLALGRPILVHAPRDSHVSRFFREHQCGCVVDTNDPGAVADAIRGLRTDSASGIEMAARARRIAEREFSIDRNRDRFVRVLSGVMEKRVSCPG